MSRRITTPTLEQAGRTVGSIRSLPLFVRPLVRLAELVGFEASERPNHARAIRRRRRRRCLISCLGSTYLHGCQLVWEIRLRSWRAGEAERKGRKKGGGGGEEEVVVVEQTNE